MQKRRYPVCLVVLAIFSFYSAIGFSQLPGIPDKGIDSAEGNRQRFYNVTTFIPVTISGQFFGGLQTISGYRLIDHLSIGGGIGYERFISIPTYEDFNADLSLLPVFADIRYTFLNRKFSPVIALNGGYKILLNRPSTGTRDYSTYSNVLTVPSRNDFTDYNTYLRGGPFFTAEVGVKAKVCKKLALFLAVDFSIWSITGDYHLKNKQYLQGSGGWVLTDSTQTTEKSLAYVNMFLFRLGIVF